MAQIKPQRLFVREIPSAPAGVVQVETAIPAFIGFTGKADEKRPDDLLLKAKRISSLPDYEKYYGKGKHIRPAEFIIMSFQLKMTAK